MPIAQCHVFSLICHCVQSKKGYCENVKTFLEKNYAADILLIVLRLFIEKIMLLSFSYDTAMILNISQLPQFQYQNRDNCKIVLWCATVFHNFHS